MLLHFCQIVMLNYQPEVAYDDRIFYTVTVLYSYDVKM